MVDQKDARQLSMFPEVSGDGSMPSISTMPDFDKALGNLIKMSDLGAFIQLNIQGLEKSYSLNLSDYPIPDDFIQLPQNYSPLNLHLFPLRLRNRIKKKFMIFGLFLTGEILLKHHSVIFYFDRISVNGRNSFNPIGKSWLNIYQKN